MGSRRKLHQRRAASYSLLRPAERTTFRTRTAHIDSFILRVFNWKSYKGKKFRVLDLGPSVLEGGAPSTEETYRILKEAGIKPNIVAVDIAIPKNFKPRIREIEYRKGYIDHMEPFGKFGYVKATNVFGGIDNPYAFKELVLGSLAKNGIVLTTISSKNPLLDFEKYPLGEIQRIGKGAFDYVILQKRGQELVPVARVGYGIPLKDRTARWYARKGKREKQLKSAQNF